MDSFLQNATCRDGGDNDSNLDTRSTGLVVFEVSFLVVVIAVSVPGNSLVVACVAVDRKLRTVSNIFVVNLAVADIIITGVLMPFIVTSVVVNDWIFGEPYCKVHGFIQTILYTGSYYTHAIIALNRYCLIAYPARYCRVFSRRNSVLVVSAIWLTCGVYALPQVIPNTGIEVVYIAEIYNCMFDGSSNLVYLCVTAALAYALPSLVTAFSYAGIYLTVRASRKRVQAASNSTSRQRMTAVSRSTSSDSSERTTDNEKLTKHLCLVTLAFFVCWAPYCIVATVDAFDDGYIPDAVHTATNWLALSNSALNPMLYGGMNRQFRSAYRKVVCRSNCLESRVSVEDAVATRYRKEQTHGDPSSPR